MIWVLQSFVVDECGTVATRQKLPKMFRLVIASWDETENRASIFRLNIDKRNIQVNHESKSDIARLFQRRLVPSTTTPFQTLPWHSIS